MQIIDLSCLFPVFSLFPVSRKTFRNESALEYLTCARKETENTGNVVWFKRHATGNKSGNRLGTGRDTGNISWF